LKLKREIDGKAFMHQETDMKFAGCVL